MGATIDRAQLMGRGWQLLESATGSLQRMEDYLAQLVQIQTDRSRNGLDQGAVPFVYNLDIGGVVIPAGTQMSVQRNPVLAANPKRRGFIVTNASPAGGPNIFLSLGSNNPSQGAGLLLPPGASFDGRIGSMFWRGSVAAVASASGALLTGVEA